MQELKDIFVFYASTSVYPNIDRRDFIILADRTGLIDKKIVFGYTIDLLFSVVNYDKTGNTEDNPNSELVRYEFIEILARIAEKLYPTSILSLALKKVIEDHLLPVYKKDFHDFSSFYANLYTLEV